MQTPIKLISIIIILLCWSALAQQEDGAYDNYANDEMANESIESAPVEPMSEPEPTPSYESLPEPAKEMDYGEEDYGDEDRGAYKDNYQEQKDVDNALGESEENYDD